MLRYILEGLVELIAVSSFAATAIVLIGIMVGAI